MKPLLIFLLLSTLYFLHCKSFKILAVFPVPFYSHYILNSKLFGELARRGHEVTLVTPFFQKTPVKNLKEVSIETVHEAMAPHKNNLLTLEERTVFGSCHFLQDMGHVLTEHTLQHPNLQKILQSEEHFDMVMVPPFLNEGLFGIAHRFKAPLVLVATMPLWKWSSFILSHPAPSSYVPNLLSKFTGRMDFWQRLTNSIYDGYTVLYHQWVTLPKHRELVRKYIPGEPDLYQFLNNASLMLLNSHVSTYEAMPVVPNVIEIGGLHIDEPKKLPEDLQKFLDDSVDGVILFSMGSNLKSADLPKKTRDEILKVFSKLKQNVLWKWETEELPGQPKNVKLMKWLPQSDVLAHPNVKAFITHGGLLSTMESVYYGVPLVGIPIFSDQKMNMATAVSYGYGLTVPFQELNEEKLTWALDQILNEPRYRDNIQKRSKIMQDRPMRPMDTAIYWVEYVFRHKGAQHLRYPGMDMYWYQRELLDVIAFVLMVIATVVVVISIVFKRMFKRHKSYSTNKKNN